MRAEGFRSISGQVVVLKKARIALTAHDFSPSGGEAYSVFTMLRKEESKTAASSTDDT